MKTIKIEIVDEHPTATVRIFREFTKFEVEEAKQFIEDIIHGKVVPIESWRADAGLSRTVRRTLASAGSSTPKTYG